MTTALEDQPAFEPPALSNVPASFAAAVAETVERFNQRWQTDGEANVAEYLPTIADPRRIHFLAGLLKSELKWRLLTLREKRIEAYLQEWPELADKNAVLWELLNCECLFRAVYDVCPDADEIESRFPSCAELVDLAAIAAHADRIRKRESFLGRGRFFLIRRIGKGGFGVVYEALDRERRARVALKLLAQPAPDRLQFFKQEFRSLADVSHPNLVSLYELFSVEDQWFFTMEHIAGVNYLNYLRPDAAGDPSPTKSLPSSIDADETKVWPKPHSQVDFHRLRSSLLQLVEGVCALHAARKIHRDIKPSNVLVKPDGTVVLLDFGLIVEQSPAASSDSTDSGSTVTWSAGPLANWNFVGTAGYTSPEQARGDPVGTAGDWYSVGVVLFEALTGERPITGGKTEVLLAKQVIDAPSPTEFVDGIPDDLVSLCRDLLKREAADRPSGDEILERLQGGASRRRLSDLVPLASQTIPFVGREIHLAELRGAFDAMLTGRSAVVHVTGRSGMGKTRLLYHFLNELASNRQAIVLSSRCHERESVPYKALDGLIDSLCHHLTTMHPEEARALLPADVGALARLFPLLKNVDAVTVPFDSLGRVSELPQLKRAATRALRELLSRLGRRHALVLMIDDMQWADRDSATILSEILRPSDPPRMLLLASYREEYPDHDWKQLFGAGGQDTSAACLQRDLQIGPLTEEESRQLVHTLSDAAGARPEIVDLIVRESRGVAYFVHELARHATSANLQSMSRASSELRLDEILWDRVGQLPAESQKLLEIVAVAGQPIDMRTAFAAARLGTRHQQSLAELRSGHFVRTSGPHLEATIETYHDRIREGVLSHLADDRQRAHHEQLAYALDRFRSPRHEITATHFHAAGHDQRAGELFELAADQAAEALAFERAASLFAKSLQLRLSADEDLVQPRAKLAAALANAGRGAEAADAFLAAAAGAEPRRSLELRREAAYQFCISGRIERGRETFAAILAAAGMKLPATPRGALLSLAKGRLRLALRGLRHRAATRGEIPDDALAKIDGSWAAAVGFTMIDTIHGADFQSRNLLLALRAGEPYRLARALCWQAAHVSTLGAKSRRPVRKLLHAARPLVEKIEQPHTRGLFTLAEGIANYFQGHWRGGLEKCDRSEAIFREHCTGVAWETATAQSFSLWSAFFMGETAKLLERVPTLLDEARGRGDQLAEASLTTLSGTLAWLALDQPDEADEALRKTIEWWSGHRFRTQHFTCLTSQVQVRLYQGQPLEAWELLSGQWPELKRSLLLHIEAIRIFCLHLRARCAIAAAGGAEDSRPFIDSAKRDAGRLEKEKAAWARPLARLIRAALADAGADQEQAIDQLGLATKELEAADMALFAVAARRRHGQLLGGRRGSQAVAQSELWMASQRIQNPEQMTALHVPMYDGLPRPW